MKLSEKHKMIYSELNESLEKLNKNNINYSEYLLPYMEKYKICKLNKNKDCSKIFLEIKKNFLENKSNLEKNENIYYECLNEKFKTKFLNSENFQNEINSCSKIYLKNYLILKKNFRKKFN